LAKFERDEGYIFNDIVLCILQPRAYHPDGPVREWRVTYEEAMDWAKYLAARAREALGHSPVFRPSDEACRFCPASGVCRHLAEFALGKARKVFTHVVDYEAEYKDVNTLSNVELGFILDNAKLFRKFLDDAYQHALGYTKRGGVVPGWGLKEKLGNRKWAIPDEELVEYFGEDITEQKIVVRSPAQAEKIFGKNSVAKFVTRESTGYALTPVAHQETRETHDTMPFDEVDEDGR
jgi:hypothetical protein